MKKRPSEGTKSHSSNRPVMNETGKPASAPSNQTLALLALLAIAGCGASSSEFEGSWTSAGTDRHDVAMSLLGRAAGTRKTAVVEVTSDGERPGELTLDLGGCVVPARVVGDAALLGPGATCLGTAGSVSFTSGSLKLVNESAALFSYSVDIHLVGDGEPWSGTVTAHANLTR